MSFLLVILAVLMSCGYALLLYSKSYQLYSLPDIDARLEYIRGVRRRSRIFLYALAIVTLGAILAGMLNNDRVMFGDAMLFLFLVWWTLSVSISSSLYLRSIEKGLEKQSALKRGMPIPVHHYNAPKKLMRMAGLFILGLLIVYVLVAIVTSA